jgi:hypothetical protein|tara:strand:- start:46 stop:273 length:228 start_codon:yes stop_codon:yes gene_type:complete
VDDGIRGARVGPRLESLRDRAENALPRIGIVLALSDEPLDVVVREAFTPKERRSGSGKAIRLTRVLPMKSNDLDG